MNTVKRWLAGFLSLAMIFTSAPYANLTVFAAENDAAAYTVEGERGTESADDLDTAIGLVKAGGKITANEGAVIDADYFIDDEVNYAFVLDLTNATIKNSAQIKTEVDTQCLHVSDAVYTYHQNHKFVSVTATEISTDRTFDDFTGSANLVLSCEYDGDHLDTTYDGVRATDEDGDYIFDNKGNTQMTADIDLLGYEGSVTWWVAVNTGQDVYATKDADYRKDKQGVAILTEDGKPQFTANYTKNGVDQYDEAGELIILNGKAEFVKTDTPASLTEKQVDIYKVTFEFPDKTTEVSEWEVVTAYELKPQKTEVLDISLLFVSEDGDKDWTLVPQNWDSFDPDEATGLPSYVDEGITYVLSVSDKGELTYAPVYRYEDDSVDVSPDDAKTLAPSKVGKKYACGAVTYTYANSVTEKCTYKGVPTAVTRTVPPVEVEGVHSASTLDQWAKTIDWQVEPTHNATGFAYAECECGKFARVIEVPRKADHVFELDDKNQKKVYEFEADCEARGFEYNGCTVSDDLWEEIVGVYDYEYSLDLGNRINSNFLASVDQTEQTNWGNERYLENTTTRQTVEQSQTRTYTVSIYDARGKEVTSVDTVTSRTRTRTRTRNNQWSQWRNWSNWEEDEWSELSIPWHPVLVAGSVTELGDHMTYVKSYKSSADWTTADFDTDLTVLRKDDDVVCKVESQCMICDQRFMTEYHKRDAKESDKKDYHYNEKTGKYYNDDDDEVIFSAISISDKPGADCSKPDTITYKVDGLQDAKKVDIATSFESAVYYGPHTYKNTVNFQTNGKKAAVVQQCLDTTCEDKETFDGNKKYQLVDAVVTSVDNEDGSTTYTATLDGFVLTNNKKTVFDLTRAKVTINNGEPVDLNTYDTIDELVAADLVTVEINGAVIDSDNYVLESIAPTLFVGNNKITVKGQNDGVDSTSVVIECVQPGGLAISQIKVDGKTKNYDTEFDYDGTAHTVSITARDDDTHAVVDANIKYAVTYKDENGVDRYADTGKKVDFANMEYNLNSVELTDARSYDVYAKVSCDGYTTREFWINTGGFFTIVINPYDTDGAMITAKSKVITYGDKTFKASTGNAQLDKMIGLSTEDISTWGVGTYEFARLVQYDSLNYDVTVDPTIDRITIEKRNATIVLKDQTLEYTGKAIDPKTLYTIDGAVNGDDLNVVVNTVGNKEIKEPGTYELVATANDPNYNIATAKATVIITPKGTDANAALDAVNAINALNDKSTPAQVADARKKYDALTETQKALVSNDIVQKLTNAEAATSKKTTDDANAALKAADPYKSNAAVQAAINELNAAIAKKDNVAIAAATAKLTSAVEAAKKATSGPEKGKTYTVAGQKYYATSTTAVSLKKAKKAKTVTVPATVTINGKKANVTGIKKGAFNKKTKTITVKTKKLTKKGVKNSLKGSKVKTVKVKVGKKKTNKKYVKKYKKYFTKKNAGKKVKVK